MKWPQELIIIRHGQSAYNILRKQKQRDPHYQELEREYARGLTSLRAIELAEILKERHALPYSDYETPLTPEGMRQVRSVGLTLHEHVPRPDVVFISPYLRTRQTFEGLVEGGLDVRGAKIVHGEDRIREQEHGLSLLYSDWRIFHVFHPEQRALYEKQGPYWYQYPQGESVSMVRDRIRSFLNMLVREHSGQVVYLVSHHLTKLCIRANLERLTPEEFVRLDNDEKPINCGITRYVGDPEAGSDGRLVLKEYNLRLY